MSADVRQYLKSREIEDEKLAANIEKIIESEEFWNLDQNSIFSILKKVKNVTPESSSIITKKLYEKFGPSSSEVLCILQCECDSLIKAKNALGPFVNAKMIKELIKSIEKSDQNFKSFTEKIDELTRENETLKKEIKEYEDDSATSIDVDYNFIIQKLKLEIERNQKEKETIISGLANSNRCIACQTDKPVKSLFFHCKTCFPHNPSATICIACAFKCHSTHILSGFEIRESVCNCTDNKDYCRCRCSYVETGRNYLMSSYYKCSTCYSDDSRKALCKACAMNCHKGHNLKKVSRGLYYCDCGADGPECKCLPVGIDVNPKLKGQNGLHLSKIPYL